MAWDMCLFVPGTPATAGSKIPMQSKRTHKLYAMDSCKGKAAWMMKVANAARKVWLREPIDGPVELQMDFLMCRPLAHYRVVKHMRVLRDDAPVWHTVRPDRTKLLRCAEDALVGIAWRDDSQVVAGPVRKLWANHGGVLIRVREVSASPKSDPILFELLRTPPAPIRDTTKRTVQTEDVF